MYLNKLSQEISRKKRTSYDIIITYLRFNI